MTVISTNKTEIVKSTPGIDSFAITWIEPEVCEGHAVRISQILVVFGCEFEPDLAKKNKPQHEKKEQVPARTQWERVHSVPTRV